MLRTFVIVAAVLMLVGFGSSPARAITFGELDGDRHPNVGTLVVQFPDDEQLYSICTGTLISSTVFLTAAHCVEFLAGEGVEQDEVFVSFDPTFDQDSTLYAGTYYYHPEYGHDHARLNDLAVIVLDEEITDITPAELPPLDYLGTLAGEQSLRDQRFTAVGYGTVREEKGGGWKTILDNSDRRFVTQGALSLTKNWLTLSMNPSTGNGGTCYGDSGGPHFLGDTNMIVSITVTGDAVCRATDATYRLDTASARAFLDDFVTLP